MRILVTGSRSWSDWGYIHRVLDGLLATDGEAELYHGLCPVGADEAAEQWAISRAALGEKVTVQRFPAKWTDGKGYFDKGAGMRRNAQMVLAFGAAGAGGQVHGFLRDESKGTSHCLRLARRAGLATTVHRWEARDAVEAA